MPTIVTWNMQGGQGEAGTNASKWASLTGAITNPQSKNLTDAPTVIFLQECSDVPNWIVPTVWQQPTIPNVRCGSRNFGTQTRPKCYFIAHYNWGNGNNRVSFALLIQTTAFMTGTEISSEDLCARVTVISPTNPAHRPLIGVQNNGVTWYSMHAPSTSNAQTSRDYVTGVIANVPQGTQYVIGGDFNCAPVDMSMGLNALPPQQLYPGTQSTCGTRILDYFTTNGNGNAGLTLNNVRNIPLLSDHSAVATDHY